MVDRPDLSSDWQCPGNPGKFVGERIRISNMLDHIILLIADLEGFRSRFETETGVSLTVGGAHPGLGTANLLASVGDGVYVEFIAPNPELDEPRGLGARLVSYGEPRIAGFAARSTDMAATVAAAEAAGLTTVGPAAGSRETPDGTLLSWTGLYLLGHVFGDQLPFYIDWGTTPHPSSTSAQGLRLLALRAVHPDPDGLATIYRGLGIPVTVVAGAAPGFELRIETPKGEYVFASDLGERIFAASAIIQD